MKDSKEMYSEIISGIDAIQKKSDENSAKYDGLIENQIKDITENVTSLMEEAQKVEALEKQSSELKKSHEDLVAKTLRSKGSDDNDGGCQAISEYKTALRSYIRRKGNEIDHDVVEKAADAIIEKFAAHESDESKLRLKKTLAVDSNPDGGYLVLPDRIAMDRLKVDRIFETSPVRSVANVITTLSDEVEIVIDDNESASGGWVSERQSRPGTDTPQIGLLKIPTHEQYAEPKATQKYLDDSSIDVERWLSEKTDDILTRTENTAFVSGDGSSKPKGFLSYDAWSGSTYERNAIEQIDSGVNGGLTGDAVKCLQNSLKESYQGNATWMLKRVTWKDVITLKDGVGAYLLNPNSLKEGDSKILLGKNVLFADDMPELATDSLSMIYGDFRKSYTIVDRMGIRVLRDPFTDKPFIKFYTTKRVGGAVTNYEGLKILKAAA